MRGGGNLLHLWDAVPIWFVMSYPVSGLPVLKSSIKKNHLLFLPKDGFRENPMIHSLVGGVSLSGPMKMVRVRLLAPRIAAAPSNPVVEP